MKFYDNDGVWVIGDVHGCFDVLVKLLNKLPKNANICFVGDLIDRGEKSLDVVDFVMKNNYNCVLGNHEDMLLKHTGPIEGSNFGYNGGDKTMANYEGKHDVLFKHINWISTLSHFEVFKFENSKDLIVSHSNIIPYFCGYDIEDYNSFKRNEIMWNRRNANSVRETKENFFNIFGHTPVENIDIYGSTAMIDTGCVFNYKLSAVHYPSMEVIEVVNNFKNR